MPLAHLTSATTTSNFAELAVAVSFAMARPGETVDDFQTRFNSRGEWGQTRYGRYKVELVLTQGSVKRLVDLISRLPKEWSTARGPHLSPESDGQSESSSSRWR